MARAIPILPMDAPVRAEQFYADMLGFSLLFEAHYPCEPEDGTILGFELDGMQLHLDCPMPGHGKDACVYLEVEDVDDYYARWSGKVEMQSAPTDQPWGKRTFDLQDPFGNTLFVVGPGSQ